MQYIKDRFQYILLSHTTSIILVPLIIPSYLDPKIIAFLDQGSTNAVHQGPYSRLNIIIIMLVCQRGSYLYQKLRCTQTLRANEEHSGPETFFLSSHRPPVWLSFKLCSLAAIALSRFSFFVDAAQTPWQIFGPHFSVSFCVFPVSTSWTRKDLSWNHFMYVFLLFYYFMSFFAPPFSFYN